MCLQLLSKSLSDVLYVWLQVRAYDKSSQAEVKSVMDFLSAIPTAEKKAEANQQLQGDEGGNEGSTESTNQSA